VLSQHRDHFRPQSNVVSTPIFLLTGFAVHHSGVQIELLKPVQQRPFMAQHPVTHHHGRSAAGGMPLHRAVRVFR